MNQDLIPTSLHWMMPIVAQLAEQRSRDADEFTLSENDHKLISQHLTTDLRKDIELWIGTNHSEETGNFLMAMIALDEQELLEPSEPKLDYEHWRSELASPLWGHVRRAVQFVAEDCLADLTEVQRLELDADVKNILETATNTNSRIWLLWLRCQIDKNLDVGRDFLRKIVDDSPVECDEEFDLGEDACCALISMSNVSQADVDSIIRFVLKEDIDEFKAVVALEALLLSKYVTPEEKVRVKGLVRKTDRDELQGVLDSHDVQA